MKLSSVCFVVAGLIGLAGPIGAEPPKVNFPNGNMVVAHGKSIVEFLPDGSIKITSSLINLVIPGGGVEPVKPVDPPVPPAEDPITKQIGTLYGSLQEDSKKEKTEKLSALWFRAVSLVDSADTLGAIQSSLKGIQTLGDNDLLPIREYIRAQITNELGTKSTATLDKPKARALFTRFAHALEEAVK